MFASQQSSSGGKQFHYPRPRNEIFATWSTMWVPRGSYEVYMLRNCYIRRPRNRHDIAMSQSISQKLSNVAFTGGGGVTLKA